MSRLTTTGKIAEQLVSSKLKERGIEHRGGLCGTHVCVGRKPNGSKHYVDIVADNCGSKTLVSVKHQSVAGTAEEKILHEAYVLQKSVQNLGYRRAVIVLDGDGWKWKNYYLSEEFQNHIKHAYPNVDIISIDGLDSYQF